MTLERKKLNVTDRVTGKLQGERMELFMENEPIGFLNLDGTKPSFALQNGFELDGNQIFKMTDVVSDPDKKYVDCDYENGWC
ncbi:DUF2553 family protein [Bacillus sp. HMF5848]|uniref:YusG family protein n=1 Tax=Bacillus sp. HMF5848 TaxID=2495421 RepID=UPI000F79DBA2|nr:YusG family protein [Bacillus sp. HMF5848]RSK28468.1 DUF2553 family protein [Bacillus sp. HMF5848]